MTEKDLKGETRPRHLVKNKCEFQFYENLPTRTDGDALTDKEAGINICKKDMALNLSQKNADYTLRRMNLRD